MLESDIIVIEMWGRKVDRENLKLLKEKISRLTKKEAQLRDLYLSKLAKGEMQGPPVGYPSIDKTWLKYYSDINIQKEMPKMSIYDYMMKKNRSHLSDNAINYFDKSITYREFDELIDKCAKSFIKSNIKEGDIVTICMPNTPEAVISFYALNKIGAVANMIHPLSSQNEIRNFINEVDSKMIITIDASYNKVVNIADKTKLEKIVLVSPADSMPIITKVLYGITQNKKKLLKNNMTIGWSTFIKNGTLDKNEIIEQAKYRNDRLSVILHTGGTTGNPKGVRLTDDNFNSMVEQFISAADNFERNDKMLTIMPVFHGFGLCSSVHLPLSAGVTVILIPKLDSKKLDKLIIKNKPNHIIGVPTLFKGIINNEKLDKADLSFLKYIVSGGDLVKDSLESNINDFLSKHNSISKLSKGYGLSEAVAGATFAYDDYNKIGSVGIPMIATNIKIVQPGTTDEVQSGQVGEICISGPTVMQGYYNKEEETKYTLKDGWLHTGDLGYYKDNILYFAQRKGNMIISSGVNVYPSNIEQVIEMHDAVATCAVIGISHSYKIQVPKAYIVLKDGYTLTEEIKQEIESLCKKNLNVYSVPYEYEFRDKLPRTLLGKVSHTQLKEEEKQKVKKLK